MKYQHPQQTHQDFPASQGLAISFFTLGLSTISIYFCIAAILEYILIAILHPEAVFQSHFILGKLICSMLLRYFVCFVLVQKLVTCFKAELLPVFKLVAASLGTIKGEGERERHRTQLEGQKAKQQEAARQVQEQANFNQKYQEWLNQMNTYICEDVISSTCTGLPSFLPSSSRSDAIQEFYDKANIGPGEFETDRKLWDFLEKEVTCRFAILRIAMLDGRTQFLERISEAKQR